MKIEIFGTGCAKCSSTSKIVHEVIQELGLKANVTKIEDPIEMANRGVFITPAIAVDGKIVVSGHIPNKQELKQLLQNLKQN